jgi:hypothetical protein
VAVLHMVLVAIAPAYFAYSPRNISHKWLPYVTSTSTLFEENVVGTHLLHFETTVTHEADAVIMFALACVQAWLWLGSQLCSS